MPTGNKETLRNGTKGYYNSIGIRFHRKAMELLLERKRTIIPRDLSVNIQASCRIYKFYILIGYYH
jgi:hypothetical protein